MSVRTLDQLLARIAFRINRLNMWIAMGLRLSIQLIAFEQQVIESLKKEYALRVRRLPVYLGMA